MNRRNLLIAFFLLLAAIQIVRVDFFINHQYFDPAAYAHGLLGMPFQGRIAMMPVLLWSEHSHAMQAGAVRYQGMLLAGSPLIEGYGPEKLVSLLTGILSLCITVAATAWYGVRRLGTHWWLPPALALAVTAVMLDLRLEHNLWYPYDLPHLALFSLVVLCALQRAWLPALLFFCVDVPVRETAVFALPIALPLFYLDGDAHRATLLRRCDWRAILRDTRAHAAAAAALALLLYWEAVHLAIRHHFAHNPDETGTRLHANLHDLLLPHHWPQLLSAGGYLALFVWLARKRLPIEEQVMLWGSLLCVPAVLYFSIWNETRVWLEWTVPIATAAALELRSTLQSSPQRNMSSQPN